MVSIKIIIHDDFRKNSLEQKCENMLWFIWFIRIGVYRQMRFSKSNAWFILAYQNVIAIFLNRVKSNSATFVTLELIVNQGIGLWITERH